MSALDLPSLTERFALDTEAAAQVAVLARILAEHPQAPTTVTEPQAVLRDHLADSLVALDLPIVTASRQMLDIGAGAGLPGLVLAAALPDAQVTLIDASGKKCAFIADAAAEMGLSNVQVHHARAEELAAHVPGTFDLVTARALAPLDVVAEYAAPLLGEGGHLVAWRGRPEPDVESAGRRAAEILGLRVLAPVRVHPYPEVDHRALHLMRKVAPTPQGYPRRAGMARKRPLGATRTGGGTLSDRPGR